MVVWASPIPRSAIIWTRSRELSLKARYHRTHSTMISWSKCRPLKRSCAEVASVIPGVTAVHRAFQAFAPEPSSFGPARVEDCDPALFAELYGIFLLSEYWTMGCGKQIYRKPDLPKLDRKPGSLARPHSPVTHNHGRLKVTNFNVWPNSAKTKSYQLSRRLENAQP